MKLQEILTSIAVGDNTIPKRLERQKEINIFLDFIRQYEEKKKLNEALMYSKFVYKNYKNDKKPKVKILDNEYPGQVGQKTYGKRKDVLGWNINYIEGGRKDKLEALKAMDEIDDFANLLGADKKEKYERITIMFPNVKPYLRRYMKKHIKGQKFYKNGLWRKSL